MSLVSCWLDIKHMLSRRRIFAGDRRVLVLYSVAAILLYLVAKLVGRTLDSDLLSPTILQKSRIKSCDQLGLPQPIDLIPLHPIAYEIDVGMKTPDFVMVTNGDMAHYDMPDVFEDSVRGNPLLNEDNIMWQMAKGSRAEDGIFIDVDGWVGDSSIITAAMGMDTYAFESARYITNMMHLDIIANDCRVSEHLTIVNAIVGDHNSLDIYLENVNDDDDDVDNDHFEHIENESESGSDIHEDEDSNDHPIAEVITLDSFFPRGTKVQNLNVNSQGHEPQVIRGAERILMENKGRLTVRFGFNVEMLTTAGNDPIEFLGYMQALGYKEVVRDSGDIVMT